MLLILLWVTLFVIMTWTLAYHHSSLSVWTIALFFYDLLLTTSSHASPLLLTITWIIFTFVALLNIYPLRRFFITRFVLNRFIQLMPHMSKTEKEALAAGTVSFEGELFSGRPSWKKLLSYRAPELSDAEQHFLNHEVETLCNMINDWEFTHDLSNLPDSVWDYIKKAGFFGLIIPTEYGGKGFSAYAHACILIKIYGRSIGVATTVSVPNSLGPAELLLKYGTLDQKNYYLPRLAKGEEIPCFALTNPEAGSDAASIPDTGIVCYGEWNNEKVVGIKLNWNKRYITLAPVATILGLAFRLFDPEKLLGEQTDIGITCALIPVNLPGINIGRRHFPLNTSFMNGPTQGKDVFIPLDFLIGGKAMVGQGWRMLMECLSAGRAISLPSSAVGGMQAGTFCTGAYARIRQQFNIPIALFEGIEEPLARIAAYTYIGNAAIKMTTAVIDAGGEPAVASAILKYHCTEMSRRVVNDCMDIQGGKGICLGPNNMIGRHYQGMPIGITVEGANILTRSLIIFGQGAIRCHPHVIEELSAAEERDLPRFDRALFHHLGHIIANSFRAFFIALTGGHIVKVPRSRIYRYFQILTRYSVAFAFVAEVSMLVLGANLKRKEKLSARLGDALSTMYLASTVLKEFHDQGYPAEDLPLVRWACRYLLFQTQEALFGVIKNFPNKFMAVLMQIIIFPFGKHLSLPDDNLGHDVASLIISDNETRNQLTALVHRGNPDLNPLARVDQAFKATLVIVELDKRMLAALKTQNIPRELTYIDTVKKALKLGFVSELEAKQLIDAQLLRDAVVAVDDFTNDELALRSQQHDAPMKERRVE